MKKITLLLIVALVILQGAAFAETLKGTVKAVDAVKKEMEIISLMGPSTIAYEDATTWPADVTDPATLVGRRVSVTTDDTTKKATSVEVVSIVMPMIPPAPAAESVESMPPPPLAEEPAQ
ncbi:MAG: hypothetical protein A3G33_03985 [Omnitrophica bacterium RIFCSPLOWO2_12_FULL_44_17]|uniref:DUF5666 domain-containing protein n=1 Tax=Candidatus Danuiimicrobium aquiferis TaxID=1801832 RepID=A0A1G1KZJ0_9BACT|nr:MAG: hypothetical protein A3B72_05265 [Omnitrophica bacterium RIFCSPHIGHO2_02_FULL_45_28]OGW89120.1 MAG: hypothetical protein A3E74_08790 [Omnitrophica bacterium RIFCSPHIGHO2_12_FULL_44_12]OGW98291.1 MAG: hypothetical protein A3G33_03985 [Omnitrophica bacterium RIFCSPLOWO2_12_FULL_44_17]OGX02885.1 MAG: hypothetical protein A3J12_04545 [Omnitrophica bacterium RIFCSPLOWO2_02_FULL_44_11]